MFSKKVSGFTDGVDTLIGVNTIFSGNIESEGTVRVDGKVNGDIKAGGDVYIGNGSVITGSIIASNVNLAGMVEGNITAKGILKILATAKLFGDIKVNSFLADEGALFQGKCDMVETPYEEKTIGKTTSFPKKNHKKSFALDDADGKDNK